MNPDEIRLFANPFFQDFDCTAPVQLVPCQFDLDDARIVREVGHIASIGVVAHEAPLLVEWAAQGMRIYSWSYAREVHADGVRLTVSMALPYLREQLRSPDANWRVEALLAGILESIRGWRDAGIDAVKLVGLQRSPRDGNVVIFPKEKTRA